MFKSRKRLISLALIAAMLLTFLVSCGETPSSAPDSGSASTPASGSDSDSETPENPNYNPTGLPIVNEPITVTALANNGNMGPVAWEDKIVLQELEARTNVHVEWETYDGTSYAEKRNLIFATGEIPDIIMKTGFTPVEEITYGSQGLLLPLGDLLEDHGEYLPALMEQYPEIRQDITSADGNIYTLPNLNYIPEATTFKIWINERWLENVDMEMPTTTDEFYEVLTAFKEQDANGNGDPNDEIPMAAGGKSTTGTSLMLEFFMGSWGFAEDKIQGGISSAMFDIVDGQVRFIHTDDKYREFLEYFNKLWSEGLIDPNYYTLDNAQLTANSNAGMYGVIPAGNNDVLVGANNQGDFVGLGVLVGPHGDQNFSVVNPPTIRSAVALSADTEYPVELTRWLDYFYSEEGSRLIKLGIEGETYVVNEDGTYGLTDFVSNNPDGLSQEDVWKQISIWNGGQMPHYGTPEVNLSSNSNAETVAATQKALPYISDSITQLSFTVEESEQLSIIQTDLTKYINQSIADFFTGVTPINDDTWNSFVTEVDKIGLEEYSAIYQAAVDRYNAN